MQHKLSLRITGFVASLILTFIAYFVMVTPGSFSFDSSTAITAIVLLALIQSLVQLIFFINVWKEDGPPWNLGVFASTASIIFVVVFFSIWIMNHLNYNMR